MTETIFTLFLLSGLVKSFLPIFTGSTLFIDITLLCSICLFGLLIADGFKNAYFKNELYFPVESRAIVFTMLVFYLWMIASLLYTRSYHYCYEKVILYLTNILALVFPFFYRPFNPRRFFHIFAYAGTALVFLYSFLLPNMYDSYVRNLLYRDFVVKYLDVGYVAGIVILLAAFACPKMKRLSRILIMGFNTWAIFISAARGPLVFLALVFAIRAAVSLFTRKSWKLSFKNIFILITGLGILGTAAFYLTDKYSTLLERSLSRFSRLTESTSGSISERVSFISFSIDTIFEKASNFLFGLGIGSFGITYQNLDERLYPHNTILEIAFELGIIGIIIFLALLLLLYRKIRFNFNYVLIFFYLVLNNLKSYSIVDQRIMFGILSIMVLENLYRFSSSLTDYKKIQKKHE
jgi:O-antigen ligase